MTRLVTVGAPDEKLVLHFTDTPIWVYSFVIDESEYFENDVGTSIKLVSPSITLEFTDLVRDDVIYSKFRFVACVKHVRDEHPDIRFLVVLPRKLNGVSYADLIAAENLPFYCSNDMTISNIGL